MNRRGWLYFSAGFGLTLFGLIIFRLVLSGRMRLAADLSAPEQPLAYSHKTHLSLGLKCQDCHSNPEPGEKMTFPVIQSAWRVMRPSQRTSLPFKSSPRYAKSQEPIPWVRVYVVAAGTVLEPSISSSSWTKVRSVPW